MHGPATVVALEDQLTAFLDGIRAQTGVPGIAAAVSVDGRRSFAAVGVRLASEPAPLERRAAFHLGCITKLLVALVVLELAAERVLDLDVPLMNYLPELRGSVHGSTITLAHLLSHTAGYRGTQLLEPGTLAWDHAAFIEYLRAAPQHFTPGTVFSYEHSGYALAGEVVRRVSGRSVLAHAARKLLAPLGIVPTLLGRAGVTGIDAGQHLLDPVSRRFKRVGWQDLAARGAPAPTPWWEPAFSSYAVPLAALLDIAEPLLGQMRTPEATRPAVRTLTVSRLLTPVVSLPAMHGGPLAELAPSGFGLGAAVWGNGFCGAAGSTYGQCQALRFDPRIGVAIAVGVNASQPYLRDLVVDRIAETLGLGVAAPPGASDSPGSARDLSASSDPNVTWNPSDLCGTYEGPARASASVTLADDRLVVLLESDHSPLRLRAEVCRTPSGRLAVSSTVPSLALGLFRAPDGTPGIMVGNRAYRRVA